MPTAVTLLVRTAKVLNVIFQCSNQAKLYQQNDTLILGIEVRGNFILVFPSLGWLCIHNNV